MSGFIPMREIFPEPCAKGEAVISLSDLDNSRAGLFNVNLKHGQDSISPGQYVKLHVGRELMMSDTPMELRSNYTALRSARGNVLIAGLGIGVLLAPILLKPEVDSVLVIEKSQDVIDLVAPKMPNQGKLTVICADILTWRPPKGQRWDYIWFDIWPDVCLDNLPEVRLLHRRFGRRCGGNQDSWMRDRLLHEERREKQRRRH